MNTITIDDFQKVEITIGKILSAEKIPDTDKLLKLSVSFGIKKEGVEEGMETQFEIRQIISGIALYFPDAQALVGTKCAFVTNLAPRIIKGFESQGMILAVSTPATDVSAGALSLFKVGEDIPEGTRAR